LGWDYNYMAAHRLRDASLLVVWQLFRSAPTKVWHWSTKGRGYLAGRAARKLKHAKYILEAEGSILSCIRKASLLTWPFKATKLGT
jgi:hypothetical protein